MSYVIKELIPALFHGLSFTLTGGFYRGGPRAGI